ncbi:MAG: NAD-dependent epimerase/dehydratase family protein [Verrucomicrobiota bacterium]
MRVLIAGCGYLGLEAGRRLARAGHEVWGLRRHPGPVLAAWQSAGIRPLAADLTRPETLAPLPRAFEAVVQAVSAAGGGPAAYPAAYLETTTRLLAWLDPGPLRCLVYTGSTRVYGQADGGWVDETAPTRPAGDTGRLLLAAEQLLLDAHRTAGWPVTLLRLAGLYGPGRSRLLDQFLSGEADPGPTADHWLNLIHRDDAAAALVAVVEAPRPGAIFNVADGQPATRRQVFEWLAGRTGRRWPAGPGETSPAAVAGRARASGHKRVANGALRAAYGWSPAFPSFREGYGALLTDGPRLAGTPQHPA